MQEKNAETAEEISMVWTKDTPMGSESKKEWIVKVYGLSSSEDGEIRYIGQTTQTLKKRLDSHVHHPKRTDYLYVCRWIKTVRDAGFSVQCTLLEDNAVWNESERSWIAKFKESGARLTNATDGGDGILGRVVSQETRDKISKAHIGKVKSQEHRENISKSHIGMKQSEETRRKHSETKKGKKPKNLAALHASQIGKPKSEEVKLKISESVKRFMLLKKQQSQGVSL